MKPLHIASNHRLLSIAIAALLASQLVQAATETWTGATNTWNTSGNWSGTNLPPISGDSLIFGAAGAGGLNLNNDLTSGSFSLLGITFNAGAPAYVIGDGTTTANVGNTFILTGNVINNSTSLQTLNTPFSMTAQRTFSTSAGGGNLTLSGNISGSGGGISKNKAGTLILSGTNSYTGETALNNFGGLEGVLRANDGVGLPTTSNLNIRVGVFETGTDLVRVGGVGAGQMQLKGGVSNNSANGFSAHGGAVNIAFGTLLSPTALTWGSGSFIPGSNTGGLEGLILNHTTANNTLDFKNAVNLNGAVRNVFVNATNSNAIATMSGALSGTGTSGLNKKGSGTLALTGTNTYNGVTTVSAGILNLKAGSLANTAIAVSGTGTLAVKPGSATTVSAGNTATAAAGASLNLGARTFDMTDDFVSTFDLAQESTFAGTALTVTSGATLMFNLGTAGTDRLAVTKTAVVSGTVTVTLDTTGAASLTPGTYNLITAESGLSGGTWQLTGGTTQTVTVGGNDYDLTFNTGDTAISITVAIGSASAYDTWATGLANQAFDFDSDNNGIPNGLQWILGGTQTESNPAAIAPLEFLDATDLILTFKRVDASVTETTLTAEWHIDLVGIWTSVPITRTTDGTDTLGNGVTLTVASNDAAPDDITIKIPRINAAPGAKLFARLKATKP
jgi:autotransporter-associated beta strand protein